MPVNNLTQDFFGQVGITPATPATGAAALLHSAGDRMLAALVFHSDHLELSEQFDKDNGFEKSVKNLTWSYAAFLSAVRAATGAAATAVSAAADISHFADTQRAQLTQAMTVAAAAAWGRADSWTGAELGPVLDLGGRIGADVEILDNTGRPVAASPGSGHGEGHVKQAPVTVRGQRVGTIAVRFTGAGAGTGLLITADRSAFSVRPGALRPATAKAARARQRAAAASSWPDDPADLRKSKKRSAELVGIADIPPAPRTPADIITALFQTRDTGRRAGDDDARAPVTVRRPRARRCSPRPASRSRSSWARPSPRLTAATPATCGPGSPSWTATTPRSARSAPTPPSTR